MSGVPVARHFGPTQTRRRAVNGTAGVVALVMAGRDPARIGPGVVEGRMARRAGSGYALLPRRPSVDAVRVHDGSCAEASELFGHVADHGRVAIRPARKTGRVEVAAALDKVA